MKRILSKQIAMLAILMMAFTYTGCSDDDDSNPTNPGGGGATDQFSVVTTAGDTYFDDYNTASGQGVNISASAFFSAYDPANPSYYVVDMRSAADFAVAHIDGAVNIGITSLVSEIDNLPTDQTIVFTCYSGQTASYATSIVNIIGTVTGHEAVNLKFGASGILPANLIKDGADYNYPTSNQYVLDFVTTAAPSKPAAGAYPTVMSEADTALELLKERAAVAVAAWADGSVRMSGADAVAHDPSSVMLINYFSEAAYADGHLPSSFQYTPKADIVTAGALNTLPTDKTVAFYCYTGQTSAQVAAYLTMAGYDAKTVMFGVNGMCFDDTAINDVPWHGPENDYTSIFVGTGVN